MLKSLLYLLSLFLFASITAASASPAAFAGSSDAPITRRAFRRSFGSVGARDTNALRMARGLGPKKPARLFSPTRVRRDPLPSSVPIITIKIKLVKKSDGSTVGYLKTSYDPISPTLEDASQYWLNSPFGTSSSTRFEILYDSSSDPNFGGRRLAIGANERTDIGEGLVRNLYFWSPWVSTPEGSTQVKDGSVYMESTIWSVDASTGVLSAEWVNPDSTKYPVQFFEYDGGGGTLYAGATGDVRAYKNEYPEFGMEEVTLVAVPIDVPIYEEQ